MITDPPIPLGYICASTIGLNHLVGSQYRVYDRDLKEFKTCWFMRNSGKSPLKPGAITCPIGARQGLVDPKLKRNVAPGEFFYVVMEGKP